MAIWPFNKKKLDQSMLPDEVSEYYKEEKVRTGRPAWLSGLLTVLVAAFLAVVLFFGGRWIYQSIFGNDDSSETATTSEEKDQSEQTQSENQNQDDLTGPTDNAGPTQDDSNDTDNDGGEVDQTPSSGAELETTPSTGATEIPNTGPGPGGLQ